VLATGSRIAIYGKLSEAERRNNARSVNVFKRVRDALASRGIPCLYRPLAPTEQTEAIHVFQGILQAQ
jgi:hypothetical protein